MMNEFDEARKGFLIMAMLTIGGASIFDDLVTWRDKGYKESVIGGTVNSLNEYTEKRYSTPKIKERENYNSIQASPNLEGFFPLRGFDYNKDGKLDKVEQLLHGGARIPFGSWHEVEGTNSLFSKLQQEYTNYKDIK